MSTSRETHYSHIMRIDFPICGRIAYDSESIFNIADRTSPVSVGQTIVHHEICDSLFVEPFRPLCAFMSVGQNRITTSWNTDNSLSRRIFWKESHHVRLINGNPLTGRVCSVDDFVGGHTSEITAIPEGDDNDEFLGWIMPRINQFSVNRSYFSWLAGKSKEYVLDARVKGGERHMIMSGEYDKVLPMDIYAEYLIKAIIAGDIDKMEQLGIYEVAPEDFALAEFVDSSKLELQRIVREGLDMLRKENA